MSEEADSMSRARAGFFYFGTLGLYYATAFGVAAAIGHGLQTSVALLFASGMILAMSAITFLALQYEEDWWGDFRDQKRGLLLGVLGNALSVGCGIWLGLAS